MPSFQKSAVFLNIVQTGGGGQPMFKNFVGNCRSFWRSFNNMKFAWKGTFEAWMVKFGGKIGTLYQMLKNAFKKHPPQNRTNVEIKGGGGQRPFEQCSKKLHFFESKASLSVVSVSQWTRRSLAVKIYLIWCFCLGCTSYYVQYGYIVFYIKHIAICHDIIVHIVYICGLRYVCIS